MTSPTTHVRTQVGIVGAGPAGLMLSHLLSAAGIDSTVVDVRSREDIETTVRAGILEQGTVDLMTTTGVGDRVLKEGVRHEGIELRYGGESHRIDFPSLTGRSVHLYPQQEVLKDLIAARLARGGDIRFGVTGVRLDGVVGDRLAVRFTGSDGTPVELRCDVVVGCDGSQGISRFAIPDTLRTDYVRAYPFGWFGILTEAPPSSDELVYARSDRGFALISSRTPTVQRMYFQCDPREDAGSWSDERIWDELRSRVAGDGFSLQEGPVIQRGVVPMRSYVCAPMRHGRLFLAGDAAHTVPPTGAKGLNLAVSDAAVLSQALERFFLDGESDLLEGYGETAADRVWRAQHFSWWMTSMLHRDEAATDFDARRQLGELGTVTGSAAGRAFLAENYTGRPMALTNPKSGAAEALRLTAARTP
ncbi:4-hydroxybenzoate 3-monooxygenase [Streptomyces sp. NBC_00059]|uniref:4-hydroxybenzoate 3-monooxygenase n=1 Tax=Streptomyces sp. NBC_00059 TaxID=2975635 RepID=UPI00224EB72F|nr:4-hydroxybenzoate 3-monooxygenase [Streptomyces sp. NBC_00059]MCX5416189.1 4-hydroxybenzoate 3-monooxygenase [Streptomyces sp. NBC_00059]